MRPRTPTGWHSKGISSPPNSARICVLGGSISLQQRGYRPNLVRALQRRGVVSWRNVFEWTGAGDIWKGTVELASGAGVNAMDWWRSVKTACFLIPTPLAYIFWHPLPPEKGSDVVFLFIFCRYIETCVRIPKPQIGKSCKGLRDISRHVFAWSIWLSEVPWGFFL